MLQDAINRFWWPALMMFGPNDDNSPNSARSLAWKIKRFGNDELRQRSWTTRCLRWRSRCDRAGPPTCVSMKRAATTASAKSTGGEFDEVINGRGICNHERLAAKRKAWDDGAWVREAALAHAEKQRARQAA